jgi:hypothetical protein
MSFGYVRFMKLPYRAEEHPVKIPLFGIKLESKATGISRAICGTFFASNS